MLKVHGVIFHGNMIPMNAVSRPGLRILVLAAGFSTRLGQPKALARVHGVSLLRRTLQLAATLTAAPIIAVVPKNAARYRNEARGINVNFATNSQRAQGLSSSVRRGIARAGYAPAVLLLPVDLVNLRRRDLRRLIARWRGSRRCVIARRIGHHGGTPLILPRWLYPRAFGVAGDIGLRDLLYRLPPDSLRQLDLPSAARDVDTQHDLRAARRQIRGRD
jgi:molybdenum cofactor cytidylyltransferase